MEKIKITKVDVKDSGMFVLGFTDPQGFNPGEATGNKKWQSLECTFLKQSIGCIVSIQTKQNEMNGTWYTNIDKVDMSKAPASVLSPTLPVTNIGAMPITERGPTWYTNIDKVDKSKPITERGPDWPITESEKVFDNTKDRQTPANLLSVKDIQISAHAMNKCYYFGNKAESNDEVYERYQYFVKKLEENG